jgi:hypothetical protein
MKRLVAVLALLLALVLGWSRPAAADTCEVHSSGDVGIVICAGVIVGRLPLPRVTVTENIVRDVVRNVKVPGPTVTVRPPAATVTVNGQGMPVPTKTVTVTTTKSGQTVTKTATPQTPKTQAQSAPVAPAPYPPATVSPAPPTKHGTMDDGKPKVPFLIGGVSPRAVLGTTAVLLLIGFELAILSSGYMVGYKDAEQREAKNMLGLLGMARKQQ